MITTDHLSHEYELSAFLARLINPAKKLDYLLALLIGTLPIAVAFAIGAATSIEAGAGASADVGDQFKGYLEFANWWSLALLLPAALFALRWLIHRVAPVDSAWPPKREPPIIRLITHAPSKPVVYDNLRRVIICKHNLLWILGIVTAVTLLDIWPVVAPYLNPEATARSDWTAMFTNAGQVSKAANATLLGVAYTAQYAITFIGVMAIILLLRHNVFFLKNVYQRRRVEHTPENELFHINLHDVNRCFGFRLANGAFNSQVIALMLGGLATLLSRYAYTFSESSSGYAFTASWPPQIPTFSFPVAGQWAMAVAWLCALVIVALPGLVKLLPRAPNRHSDSIHASVELYLKEFFADENWPIDEQGRHESVQQVANRFSSNAFWPSGDNRARSLFFFSYLIFFVLLLPPALNDAVTLLLTLLVFAGFAYLATFATFKIVNLLLGYVDQLLVTPNNKPHAHNADADVAQTTQLDVGIFISYRRKDTVEYARAIHEALREHFLEERLFRDLSTIAPGENFVTAIENSLAGVDYIIVLIGADWVSLTDSQGQVRLHKPDDMVRLEVATALKSTKRVIPVLLEGASMPGASDLPDDLHAICQLNALEITDSRWDYDVARLIGAIKKYAV